MSNITENYRKPVMLDETGKAIADKLDGKTTVKQNCNISESYRKPPMTDETAQLILEKIGGGGSSGGSFVVNITEDENMEATADKTYNQILEALESGKFIYATFSTEYKGTSWVKNYQFNYIPLNYSTSSKFNFVTTYVSDGINYGLDILLYSDDAIVIHEFSYSTQDERPLN